jgi:hypothetical protein
MGWPGYFTFGGTEMINASRTEAYANHYGVGWFKPVYNEDDLAWLINDPRYTTPLQDDAPWADYDNLDSYDFYGVYPLDVTGIEDSTVNADITESVIDGGYVSKPRRTTRTVVFSAVLVGASECAVEYGMRWLRTVLSGNPCYNKSYGVCGGVELCYLACAPVMGDDTSSGSGVDATVTLDGGLATLTAVGGSAGLAEACYEKIGRTLHDVTTITGPAITQKMPMTDGGCAWSVTWTMVAANPAEFGVERPLIVGFLDPKVDVPYYGGIVPPGGNYDEDGNVQSDPGCPVVAFRPVFDPLCGLLSLPPEVPTVVPTCFSFPVNYLRTSFVIPREEIPVWTTVAPKVAVTANEAEVRSVRVRFYADLFDTGDPENDPCNYCGDVVFSYVPPHSTIVLDCADRQVYIDQPGIGRRRADALVSDSKGDPFEWPEFSCGFGYVVTVDMPQQIPARPVVDLSLVPRMV